MPLSHTILLLFQEPRSPLQIPGIKLVIPINPTARMTAQSGLFTLHGDPWSDMMDCAGKRHRPAELDLSKLICWPVQGSCKKSIVLDLERVAINSRTLFPDLEGLAKGLWQTEIIGQCFEE